MRVQQLIGRLFKQAFHKMFAKRCRILHTSGIRKRRHKDPSCIVIVVPHNYLYQIISDSEIIFLRGCVLSLVVWLSTSGILRLYFFYKLIYYISCEI